MRWGPLTGKVSLLCCLNHLNSASSTSFRSGFQNRFILDPFRSNALVILVLFFQIVWLQNLGDHIPDTRQLSFLHFLFVVSLYFSFDALYLPFIRDCSHVTTLPVSCELQEETRRRKLYVQCELPLVLWFSWPEIYVAHWKRKGLAFTVTRRWQKSTNNLLFWKTYWNRWLAISLYAR
jgi:hypothetical protein